jgi:hypothetical protein
MDSDFQTLARRLLGRWTTEATHPELPGVVISGTGHFEWLDGEQFLIARSHYDYPEIPDAISVLGEAGGLCMHYYDSRGVSRRYALTVAADGWTLLMDRRAPADSFAESDAPFSQRITYTFGPGDETMAGKGALSRDDVHWLDDLEIRYRRTS